MIRTYCNKIHGGGKITSNIRQRIYISRERFNFLFIINKFLQHYIAKADDAANATKFDKAATPEAQARAQDTKNKIAKGVEMVKGYFK